MKLAKKFIDFSFQVLSVKDAGSECVIEGFANTSTKDRVGDVVLPSAFEKSLKTYLDNPILLENHDWSKVAGVTRTAEIHEKGLFIRARVSDTRPDLKTQIREGCLRTFSIGYNELDSDFDESTKTKIIKDLELLEISIVSVPANPEAKFQEISGNTDKPAPKEDDSTESADAARNGKPPAAGEDAAASASPGEEKDAKGDALQGCVSDKIPKLIAEGYEQDQAIAIAFSQCGEKSAKKSAKPSCKECGSAEANKPVKHIGKLLTFIHDVKNILQVEKLEDSTVFAICEYFNSNPEEIMNKDELIKLLRAKASPAESDKPAAGNPADGEQPKPADEAPSKDALAQILAKLDAIASALAQLLEDEAQEQQEDEAEDAQEGDEQKSPEQCKECGEPMEKDASGEMSCKNGHKAEQPKPEAEEDEEKSIEALEAEIQALETALSSS